MVIALFVGNSASGSICLNPLLAVGPTCKVVVAGVERIEAGIFVHSAASDRSREFADLPFAVVVVV